MRAACPQRGDRPQRIEALASELPLAGGAHLHAGCAGATLKHYRAEEKLIEVGEHAGEIEILDESSVDAKDPGGGRTRR